MTLPEPHKFSQHHLSVVGSWIYGTLLLANIQRFGMGKPLPYEKITETLPYELFKEQSSLPGHPPNSPRPCGAPPS